MVDARFEDVRYSDRPLRLLMQDAGDVPVASALVQDAVGLSEDISWMPRRRRMTLLVNRFRWEDKDDAERQGRVFERVRSALVFDGVLRARVRGLDPRERDVAFAVLSLTFEPGDDGAGTILLTLAGDGDIALDVEAVDARLVDLTKPWAARAADAPDHGIDNDD